MCLQHGHRKPQNDELTGIGYKAFQKTDKGLEALIQGNRNIFKINKWINELQHRGVYNHAPPEGYGFHIFKKKKHALAWTDKNDVTLKIKYRKVTRIGITGYTDKFPTIVAQEILILPKQG